MPTKSIADRPRYWLLDLSLGLFCLLNLRHRELTIDPVRHEANAITGLHCFQHRRIGRAERHSHPRVHLFLIGPCLIMILPADSSILVTSPLTYSSDCATTAGRLAPSQSSSGARAMYLRCRIVISCVPVPSHYFTMILPCMPAS